MTEAGYHRRRPRRLVGSCRAANLPAAASPGLHEVLLAYYLSEYESWESGVARTSCMPQRAAQPPSLAIGVEFIGKRRPRAGFGRHLRIRNRDAERHNRSSPGIACMGPWIDGQGPPGEQAKYVISLGEIRQLAQGMAIPGGRRIEAG